MTHPPPSDQRVERVIGRLLQIGVFTAAAVVLAGAAALLARDGRAPADFRLFRGEPESLRSLAGILRAAATLDSRAVVQFGLVLLIATQVARVALTLVAFALQRDRTYVVVTAIVLLLLLYSLWS